MKSLKGTQTEKNLLTSFAGESQARNRYTFFASQAKKDGYVLVQAVFEEIANQEKEHAKKMFKWLEGSTLEITASFPAGVIGDTAANLRAAAGGEHEEWSEAYPAFADKADEGQFSLSSTVLAESADYDDCFIETTKGMMNASDDGPVFDKNIIKWDALKERQKEQ